MKHIPLIAACCSATAVLLVGASAPTTPTTSAFPPYQSVGNVPEITGRATGFFRVEQKEDGRWWLIDPEGKGYVSFGIDHCNYRGHSSYKLGYYLYRRNNDVKFMTPEELAAAKARYLDPAADRLARDAEAGIQPPAYAVRWGDETAARLREWGFNAMGSTCDDQFATRGFVTRPLLRMSEVFARQGEAYDIAPHRGGASTVFPNVFHPEFPAWCDRWAAERCAPNKDNPWYLGYYIDNELAWWGRSNRKLPIGLFNLTIAKDAAHTAKIALRNFLERDCGGDLGKFNRLWGTSLGGFDEILKLSSLPENTAAQIAAKDRFLGLIAETYFKTTSEAIRRHDPNHLVLGCRFANIHGAGSPSVWKAAGKYCDALSVNIYPYANLDENCVYSDVMFQEESLDDVFRRLYSYSHRPMLVTEWSFPALDAGVPSTNGAGQRFKTQRERAQATSLFARTMLSEKSVVGYDYFMWCDEPAGGITKAFPENSNYGLVNADGVPYAPLVEMFTELHKHPAKYRNAPVPARRPVPAPRFRTARDAAPRLHAGKPSGKAAFVKDGDNFTLSNARIALRGKIGATAAIEEILLAGDKTSRGSLKLQVQERNELGIDNWRKPRKIAAVSGRHYSDGTAEATITALGWSYLLVVKVVLPADADCFLTELVSIKNIAAKPFNPVAVYTSLVGAPGHRVGERMAPGVWNAPTMGYWADAAGNFMGSAAPAGARCKIVFYQGQGLTADAFLAFGNGLKLAPGITWQAKPQQHGAMLHLFGKGGKPEFVALAERLTAELRMPDAGGAASDHP